MICEACEYFTGSDCWANPKSVEPCTPERTCPRFKYEASYGKVAELERERCAEIVEKVCRKCEICMHRSIIYNVCRIGGSWVGLPSAGRCDDWKPHPNVEIGIEIERARCLEICAEVRRTALRQTTGDMAHANGIAVGAEFCERKIRGGQ